MEQHPVPRNISGFQFHLIGDMTLRQFVYLAVGILFAYVAYKFAPFPALISYPLAAISGLVGFAFAFLPIQERPLDKWLAAFIKSVTSPTQYIWTKDNLPLEILIKPATIYQQVVPAIHHEAHKEANEKLRAYLAGLPQSPHESLNLREKKYIDATLSLFQTSGVVIPVVSTAPPPVPTLPTKPVPPQPQPAIQPIKTVPTPLPPAPKIEPEKPEVSKVTAENKVSPDFDKLHKSLADLAAEKKLLEQELTRLKQELTTTKAPSVVKPAASIEENEPTIKTVSPKNVSTEIGITNFDQHPNIITGVIKDPQKKILPNIILTIKDKNQMPLRALKTNKLGQFATATPLPNGTYLLEAEDPLKRYVFDIAEISLSGKVFLPIEITAKGEKELMREKLSKELFGSAPV